MPTSCECDDIVVEDCPPYLSVETFNKYTEIACANCTGTDTTTGDDSLRTDDYMNYFEFDECCPVLTVYKGSQIIYSFDSGVTWIETGTALAKITTTLGSVIHTAGVIHTHNAGIGNSVINSDERGLINLAASEFDITENGNYLIMSDFQFVYTAATNLQMLFEIVCETLPISPMRMAQTLAFNGANPTDMSSTRWMRLSMMKAVTNADNSFRYRTYGQITTFTGNMWIYTYVLKLSN